MVFRAMRNRMKAVIYVVAAAFALSVLFVGGSSWLGNSRQKSSVEAVASVNGAKIGYTAWQQAYIQLVQSQEAGGNRITADQTESAQYYALQQLINRELLLQQAADKKIKPGKAEINAQLKSIKDQFSSPAEFKQQLAASNMTEADLRGLVIESLMLEELRNQVTSDVAVTVDEVKQAYEEVKASHILIRPEEDTDESKAIAKAKAEAVLARLQSGEDFATVAKEASEDPGSAANGGDLGFFKRGQMVPEFEAAAFSLGVGEVSGLVESKFGFHIIKVEDKKAAEGEEFDKAQEELREQVKSEKVDKAFNEWFESIKNAANIEMVNNRMRAHDYLLNENLDKAVDAYKLAINEEPENPYLYASLAGVYEQLDKPEDALAQLELAAGKAEHDSSLQLRLGQKYQEAGKTDEAIAAFKKASDLDPMNFMLHLQLLNTYQSMGQDELVKVEEGKLTEIQKVYAERAKAQEELQKKAQEQAEGASTESGEAPAAEGSETDK